MTLAALIRKREFEKPANANPAKAAKDGQGEGEPLAGLAALALANPTDAKSANAATSWGWLLHFADRESLEVYCNPDATHAAILERYPDALAAEPIPERTRRTPTEAEAAELRALVQAIGKAEQWTADETEWAMAGALADPDGALICFRDIAEGFNVAVENNDRTVNDSAENSSLSGGKQ